MTVLAIILMVILAGTSAAIAERRLALVIGIDNYHSISKLEKATGDASAMASALEGLGFEVTKVLDADGLQLNIAIASFTARLTRDDVAFVHFSGHGVEIDGDNFLLPADIPTPTGGSKDVVKYEAVGLRRLIAQIGETGARTKLFVVDACRDNPFEEAGVRAIGSTRGLTRIEAPSGTFIMYSAGYRQRALDRLGPEDTENTSVYTRVLLKGLRTPGKAISQIAREVRKDVQRLAKSVGHSQRPAYYDELSAPLVLKTKLKTPKPKPAIQTKPRESTGTELETQAWNLVKGSGQAEVVESFLTEYPNSRYAPLARLTVKLLRNNARQSKQVKQEKVVALADPAKPTVEQEGSTSDQVDTKELVRGLQRELNRVGCSAGRADGNWGRKSFAALRSFARHSSIELASLDPSKENYEVIKQHNSRVCPLICGRRHRAIGDKCVLKTCGRNQELTQSGSCIAKKKPSKSRKSKVSSQKRKPTPTTTKNQCGRCYKNYIPAFHSSATYTMPLVCGKKYLRMRAQGNCAN